MYHSRYNFSRVDVEGRLPEYAEWLTSQQSFVTDAATNYELALRDGHNIDLEIKVCGGCSITTLYKYYSVRSNIFTPDRMREMKKRHSEITSQSGISQIYRVDLSRICLDFNPKAGLRTSISIPCMWKRTSTAVQVGGRYRVNNDARPTQSEASIRQFGR